MWTFVLALGGLWLTAEVGKQLYTAAMHDYIFTGRRLNRKVYRDENPSLFRANVLANIVMFPLMASGSGLFLVESLDTFLR